MFNRLIVAIKSLFFGKSALFDYICEKFNNLVCKPDIANRIGQVVSLGEDFLYIANMLSKKNWMPDSWRPYFVAVTSAVDWVVCSFKDGKVTPEEITDAINKWKIAYATWISED